MRSIVLDASALVEFLMRTEKGYEVERRIDTIDSELHIPALCDIEVCAALRRGLLHGALNEQRTLKALQDYCDLPLFRHGHLALMEDILALRANFSAYDATYVALFKALGGAFLTCDRALARAIRKRFPEGAILA